MFVVVAYDIEDDKRRLRLHKTLKNFGTPVQYSIFECILEEVQLRRMKESVQKLIKEDTRDRVRYYYLCEGCRKRIEVSTNGAIAQDPKAVIL